MSLTTCVPRRVKVYELHDENWMDKGTGHCIGIIADNVEEASIIVKSEEDQSNLLRMRIAKEDIYQKQQDTLIVWTDNDGIDLALSFQEVDGCQDVWNFICDVQKRMLRSSDDFHADGSGVDHAATLTLPEPSIANIEAIEKVVKQATFFTSSREKLAESVLQDKYIDRLTALVEPLEDLGSLKDLHSICSIVKTILLLNDNAIFEYILQADVINGVLGALEYDPEFPNQKANHRTYLLHATRFKEVVPIDNDEIKEKIHQTFRLQYLKDVVLARILDDPTFSILNSLIFFNQVDIVNYLQQDETYLARLFDLLKRADLSEQIEGMKLLQQFCILAKSLQVPSRTSFYQQLVRHGYFEVISQALSSNNEGLRTTGIDVLKLTMDHDAFLVRTQIMRDINSKKVSLMDLCIEQLSKETSLGLKSQVMDIIKILLDTGLRSNETFTDLDTDKKMDDPGIENFLQHFYDHCVNRLMAPLLSPSEIVDVPDCVELCDILAFMIRQHSFRSKYFVLSTPICLRIAHLIERRREKHLKLAGIRFFRTCIGMNDEFFNRYFIKHSLIDLLLRVLISSDGHDNLVLSATLELFDYIRRENIKPIINYLFSEHASLLEKLHCLDVIQQLLRSHTTNNQDRKLSSLGIGDSLEKTEILTKPDVMEEEKENAHQEAYLMSEDTPNPSLDFAPMTKAMEIHEAPGAISSEGDDTDAATMAELLKRKWNDLSNQEDDDKDSLLGAARKRRDKVTKKPSIKLLGPQQSDKNPHQG